MQEHASINPSTPNARKYEQVILRELASVGQRAVAGQLSVDESTISRMKSEGRITFVSQLLDALGLKVVPQKMVCYDEDYIASIHKLAQVAMQTPPQELEWEE